VLLGGAGNDKYDFTVAAKKTTSIGNDTISDDSGSDAISLDAHTQFTSQRVNNDLILTLTSDATGAGANGTVQILDDFGTHPVESLFVGSPEFSLATAMIGGNGNGIISGTDGNDVMDGRGGNDILFGNGGNDQMQGGTGNDQLFGGADDDDLDGGAGNDHLDGGSGNDELRGNGGRDVLTGGPGADTFSYAKLSDSGVTVATRDVITDFSQIAGDKIDLSAIDANTTTLGMQAFTFLGTNVKFDGHPGELRAYWTAGGQIIEGDVNGDIKPDFSIALQDPTHAITLTSADFLGTATGGSISLADNAPNIALLVNHIASTFATAGEGQGGTLLTEAPQATSQQLLLTTPHVG
jgi:Ca2+-binding RTX toxin-like protein